MSGMEHEPLCPAVNTITAIHQPCLSCHLIARVREAEFKRITQHDRHSGLACWTNWQAGYAKGRADALAEARKAVATIGHDGDNRNTMPTMRGHWVFQAAALAAIDALKPEVER